MSSPNGRTPGGRSRWGGPSRRRCRRSNPAQSPRGHWAPDPRRPPTRPPAAGRGGRGGGGGVAAEMAGVWGASVRGLALVARFGLFDEENPATDPWAQRAPDLPGLLCADPARWEALKTEPEGQNSPEWPIEQTRAAEAAARIFWPLGNTKLEKRLPLITAPTLLWWDEQDRIRPKG